MSVSNGELQRLGLTLDPQNANSGTKRGLELLERSLEEFGAGRSVVADADGVVRAGNKTLAAALEKGIPVRVVETDGKTLTVLKRTDLRGTAAKEYGIADNRVSEVDLVWDAAEMETLAGEGVDLQKFWFNDELEKLFAASITPDATGPLAITDPRGADQTANVPSSAVRMVQLFLNLRTFEEFADLVAACAKRFSTANPTDTVMAALRACAKS